jgi:hypothetical protein
MCDVAHAPSHFITIEIINVNCRATFPYLESLKLEQVACHTRGAAERLLTQIIEGAGTRLTRLTLSQHDMPGWTPSGLDDLVSLAQSVGNDSLQVETNLCRPVSPFLEAAFGSSETRAHNWHVKQYLDIPTHLPRELSEWDERIKWTIEELKALEGNMDPGVNDWLRATLPAMLLETDGE